MSRAIFLGSLLALAQAGSLKAQDGPVRSVFPNLPNPVPSRDSGIMDVYGPEIDVGLDSAEFREIMRALATEMLKKRATRANSNCLRYLGDYLFSDGDARDASHHDFNAPSEKPRGVREPDLRPAPNQRHGQVQILVMAESARSCHA